MNEHLQWPVPWEWKRHTRILNSNDHLIRNMYKTWALPFLIASFTVRLDCHRFVKLYDSATTVTKPIHYCPPASTGLTGCASL